MKLYCDVRDGSLVSQPLPNIPGVVWQEVPGTRIEIGGYFQEEFVAEVDDTAALDLPEYCWIGD